MTVSKFYLVQFFTEDLSMLVNFILFYFYIFQSLVAPPAKIDLFKEHRTELVKKLVFRRRHCQKDPKMGQIHGSANVA